MLHPKGWVDCLGAIGGHGLAVPSPSPAQPRVGCEQTLHPGSLGMGELLCAWLSATQPSTLHHQGSPTTLLISGGVLLCGEGPRSHSRHRPSQPVGLPPNHPSLSVHTQETGLTLPVLLSEETACAEAPRKLPVTLRVTPEPTSQPHPFQLPHPSSQPPGLVHNRVSLRTETKGPGSIL